MSDTTASNRADEKRPARKKSSSPRKQHGSSDANRIVVAILEVLGGLRSPTEAATSLKVSLPRYYILETRALEGMVGACEPKPLGKQPSHKTRIAGLEKELEQAHRQCARQQALVRAAQRSVGLSTAPTQQIKTSSKRDRKGRKKRRPTVRALKAADSLRNRVAAAETPEVQQVEPAADPKASSSVSQEH